MKPHLHHLSHTPHFLSPPLPKRQRSRPTLMVERKDLSPAPKILDELTNPLRLLSDTPFEFILENMSLEMINPITNIKCSWGEVGVNIHNMIEKELNIIGAPLSVLTSPALIIFYRNLSEFIKNSLEADATFINMKIGYNPQETDISNKILLQYKDNGVGFAKLGITDAEPHSYSSILKHKGSIESHKSPFQITVKEKTLPRSKSPTESTNSEVKEKLKVPEFELDLKVKLPIINNPDPTTKKIEIEDLAAGWALKCKKMIEEKLIEIGAIELQQYPAIMNLYNNISELIYNYIEAGSGLFTIKIKHDPNELDIEKKTLIQVEHDNNIDPIAPGPNLGGSGRGLGQLELALKLNNLGRLEVQNQSDGNSSEITGGIISIHSVCGTEEAGSKEECIHDIKQLFDRIRLGITEKSIEREKWQDELNASKSAPLSRPKI